jgi:hypothetical protein
MRLNIGDNDSFVGRAHCFTPVYDTVERALLSSGLLPSSLLVSGTNILAIELHQVCAATTVMQVST